MRVLPAAKVSDLYLDPYWIPYVFAELQNPGPNFEYVSGFTFQIGFKFRKKGFEKPLKSYFFSVSHEAKKIFVQQFSFVKN